MSGFYLVTRGITSHPLFKGKPERLAVWMWLMDNVAWQDTTHDVSGKTIPVPRGAVCASSRHIAEQCGVGHQVVRTALKRFQDDRMINTNTTHGKAVITLCNYEKHQQPEKAANTPPTQQQHTANTQKKQGNKGTRKDTNVSLDAKVSKILSSAASASVAADFVAHRREIKKPMTERAAKAMAEKLHGHHDPDAVLKDSISNGWQGVFPDRIRPKFQSIDGGKTQNAKRPIADHFEDSQPEMDCWPDRNASQPLLPASDERTDSGGCDARLDQGPVWLFSGTDQRCL